VHRIIESRLLNHIEKIRRYVIRHMKKEWRKNMKKQIIVGLFLAFGILLLVSSMVMAGSSPGTGIKGTSHDLSSATGRGNAWGAGVAADPTLDRICIYCHAPHHTLKAADAKAADIDYFPLWNHQLSNLTYMPYSNTDLNNPVTPNAIQHQLNANLGQPGGVSKLCLSCHDGTVAVSAYGYAPASSVYHSGTKTTDGTRFDIGSTIGNLQNHHPIGFDYQQVAAADDEIYDANTRQFLGNNPYGLYINDVLWGGKMECTSCHDVHNTKNTGTKFVWVADVNSNFCLSCHRK
jgi:predicted CXXCH cytochrome family protein